MIMMTVSQGIWSQGISHINYTEADVYWRYSADIYVHIWLRKRATKSAASEGTRHQSPAWHAEALWATRILLHVYWYRVTVDLSMPQIKFQYLFSVIKTLKSIRKVIFCNESEHKNSWHPHHGIMLVYRTVRNLSKYATINKTIKYKCFN